MEIYYTHWVDWVCVWDGTTRTRVPVPVQHGVSYNGNILTYQKKPKANPTNNSSMISGNYCLTSSPMITA
jgi:hypothetical protein